MNQNTKSLELTIESVMKKSATFEPPILVTTVRRWATVIRAFLGSTWMLVAPWLAFLVTKT